MKMNADYGSPHKGNKLILFRCMNVTR